MQFFQLQILIQTRHFLPDQIEQKVTWPLLMLILHVLFLILLAHENWVDKWYLYNPDHSNIFL